MSGIEFQEEQILSSKEIEPAEDVRQRWNESNQDFVHRLQQYKFKIHFSSKPPRRAPNGDRIFLCRSGTVENIHCECGSYDDEYYDLEGVYLDRFEVITHEGKYTYLKYPVISGDERNQSAKDEVNTFLTAEDICARWSVSPAQLVDIIKANKDLPVYFKRSTLDDLPF